MIRIYCLLDQSGSMAPHREMVESGFNGYLTSVARLPDTVFSLTLFSGRATFPFWEATPAEIPPLSGGIYTPMGATALYDAIGSTLSRIEDLEHRDTDLFIVPIFTDGVDTMSQEYRAPQIRQMVAKRTRTGRWTFLYFGPGDNRDLWRAARDLGIPRERSYRYLPAQSEASFALASAETHSIAGRENRPRRGEFS